jgi:hypothetical protein
MNEAIGLFFCFIGGGFIRGGSYWRREEGGERREKCELPFQQQE